MSIFSSKWKYYAYAASVPLFEENDHPHTFDKVMLEGMSVDDSFFNILTYTYRTDMYARARAMVRYATREVNPYFRGLPTSDFATFEVQKPWVESAIKRDEKVYPLLDFYWMVHGIYDADFIGNQFIHDHYLDINYFPWPQGCLPPIKNPKFNDGLDHWIPTDFEINTSERVAEMVATNGKLYSAMVGQINPGDIISLRAVCCRNSDDPAQTGQINLTFYDGNNIEISTASAANTETPANEWELLTVIATAPAGTATVQCWAGGTMPSCAIISTLAHWWTMDEASNTNRADSVGDATLIDGSNVAQSSTVRWGYSAVFASDFFTASMANSSIQNQNSFSGSLWFRYTTSPSIAGRPYCLIKRGLHTASNSTGESWTLGISQTNRIYFHVSGPVLNRTITWNTSGTNNTWYHVYFYYNSITGEIGLSRNNATIQKTTFGGTDLMYDLDELDVGRWSSASTQYFTGTIDEIGLWNRLLEPAERTFLYGPAGSAVGFSGLGLFCNPGDLILWAGPEITSNASDYVNFYFYEGSNGIPTYLSPPYDSTCGYYIGNTKIGWARVISDKYSVNPNGMGNNVDFNTGQYLIKFEVVEVLSGSPQIYHGSGMNYGYGRENQWWDLFRCDIALDYTVSGTSSVRLNITIAVDSGTGDSSTGNGIPEEGTEVTRSCVLSVYP